MDKYLRNKKIRLRPQEEIEPQETFLDSLARKREQEFGITEKKLEVPLSPRILQGFLFFILILISVLFIKTFQLQVLEKEEYLAKAQENKFIIRSIQASRGVIYDRNLKQLVFNKPAFDLVCQKYDLPEKERDRDLILEQVSQIVGINFEDLKTRIEESKSLPVLISENLDHQTLIVLETKIEELSGFKIQNNTIREYVDGKTISHLIGYTGRIKTEELKEEAALYSVFDYVGRDGLEKYYEKTLRKIPGKLQIERDTFGNQISKEIIQFPGPGKSLVLWLDSDLQEKIREELEKGAKAAGTQKAAAVALDPKTGGVLALVSLPVFDNNLFSKGEKEALEELFKDENEPLFNRVIAGRYLVGSTIKPLIASAVLEEKLISPQKKINCQGKITIPNPWDPSLPTIKGDWMTHGWTDMRKAIAESCNVYFYTIGGGYEEQKGLGPTKIKEYLELFGWGDKTGVDLPGEKKGFIPDKEWKKKEWNQGWWDGDTYNLSIGQGFLLITPLEIATSFVPIANGGELLQPSCLKEIVDSEKNIIEEIKPKIIRENFIDPENLQIVREGMRQAVTYGSAVNWLNSLPVSAAAKTGTAELGNYYYHNWITVFAPYEDPQIVLTIVLEDVKGMQTAALPIAKEVLNWYFK